jgi:aryl-alcohol dehydrogenase-like predicted oxidoreductase
VAHARVLGRSGIKVSDIGFGCWAIGGLASSGGQPLGWGSCIAAICRWVAAVLEELVAEGRIRAYGWSTDGPRRAAAFAAGPHCAAIQPGANVLTDAPEMFTVCDDLDLAGVIREPLAMGLLSGKYTAQSQLPADDVRSGGLGAPAFTDGRPAPRWLERARAIRHVLTSGGRTPAQGALGWLLARSPRAIPIPGVRTVGQADENAGAIRTGPLSAAEAAEHSATPTTAPESGRRLRPGRSQVVARQKPAQPPSASSRAPRPRAITAARRSATWSGSMPRACQRAWPCASICRASLAVPWAPW